MHTYRAHPDISVLADYLEVPGLGFLPVNAFVIHAAQRAGPPRAAGQSTGDLHRRGSGLAARLRRDLAGGGGHPGGAHRVRRGHRRLHHRPGDPGNLITHLRRLDDAGYVRMEKSGRGVNGTTSVSLTREGRGALDRYTSVLRDLLDLAGRPVT